MSAGEMLARADALLKKCASERASGFAIARERE